MKGDEPKMTMALIVGGMPSPPLDRRVVCNTCVSWHAGSCSWRRMRQEITLPSPMPPRETGWVYISAPAAVVTILVSSTSERHPYRLAEHMSLCCCLRHVVGLQVRVNVS